MKEQKIEITKVLESVKNELKKKKEEEFELRKKLDSIPLGGENIKEKVDEREKIKKKIKENMEIQKTFKDFIGKNSSDLEKEHVFYVKTLTNKRVYRENEKSGEEILNRTILVDGIDKGFVTSISDDLDEVTNEYSDKYSEDDVHLSYQSPDKYDHGKDTIVETVLLTVKAKNKKEVENILERKDITEFISLTLFGRKGFESPQKVAHFDFKKKNN